MAATRGGRRKAPDAVLFGQSLRHLRTERGWSQERLAEAAGITLNYVGNLERGEQGPSLNVLLRLARGLEIDLSTLFAEFSAKTLHELKR